MSGHRYTINERVPNSPHCFKKPWIESTMSKRRKRKRLVNWLRRHHLLKNKRKNGALGDSGIKERKWGCLELHTSIGRTMRLSEGVSPTTRRGASSNETVDRRGILSSPISFHSCYSYERENYNWWWMNTASEVLRYCITSVNTRIMSFLENKALNNEDETMGTNNNKEQDIVDKSTRFLSQTIIPQSNSDTSATTNMNYYNPNSSFWLYGKYTTTDEADKFFTLLSTLNTDFPYCDGSLYIPPINSITKLKWSAIDEERDRFVSLRPTTTNGDNRSEIYSLANSMRGHWMTDMCRSSSIEQQFKFMGVSYMKRGVLARIAIPLSCFLEDLLPDKTFSNLHTWIHTPLGLRHLSWSTIGELCIDDDQDCGKWIGVVRAVRLFLTSVNKEVSALQRIMMRPNNLEAGLVLESRCILPDHAFGKVLFFQIDSFPHAFTSGDYITGAVHTSRVLRFEHPVDNIQDMTSKSALTESGAMKDCRHIVENTSNLYN